MEDKNGIKPIVLVEEGFKVEDAPDELDQSLIEEFKRNIVWVSIMKLVEEHIGLLNDLTLTCPPSRTALVINNKITTQMGIEYFQGCIEECENFLTYPDRLVKDKKSKEIEDAEQQ